MILKKYLIFYLVNSTVLYCTFSYPNVIHYPIKLIDFTSFYNRLRLLLDPFLHSSFYNFRIVTYILTLVILMGVLITKFSPVQCNNNIITWIFYFQLQKKNIIKKKNVSIKIKSHLNQSPISLYTNQHENSSTNKIN